MGKETEIAWTDHTFNPCWGCQRVSPGCERCYAETFAKRTGHNVWGPSAEYRRFGDKHWNEPLKWNRDAGSEGVRRRVFCASMADVFDLRGPVEDRARLWKLIIETPHLDWLLLTKRPQNIAELAPAPWVTKGFPPNVWLGTTVEDQKRAEERIPVLLDIPAAVRFLSCEPLLGPINVGSYLGNGGDVWPSHLDWVICGGESGPGARPFALEWAERLLNQCAAAGVPFFMKQLGAFTVSEQRTTLEGEWAWRAGLKDRKGGDPAEWPEELRVRQFPEVRP